MAEQATGTGGLFDRSLSGAPMREMLQTKPAVVVGNTLRVLPAPDIAAQPRVVEPRPFAGRLALVADDSEMNRMILRTFLERLGFGVTLAADGRQAVQNWRPEHDLLCLDIQMPEQDGMAALADIRVRVAARGLVMPLALAVTVNSLSHQVAQYLSCGFDACLPKPFARAELESLLRSKWT